MITKMKKLTFLIYHKEYEQFLQSIRDLGVIHVAEKAQGTPENTELQESIRLSNRYTSTVKFLQALNAELKEQKGDVARGEKALEEPAPGPAEAHRNGDGLFPGEDTVRRLREYIPPGEQRRKMGVLVLHWQEKEKCGVP